MRDFLKRYEITLHILTPVHIGSGDEISKKEYIFYPANRRVLIPDPAAMLFDIRGRNLGREFETYMMDGRETLLDWLHGVGYKDAAIRDFCRYEMDCSETTDRPQGIHCFMKDPYGMPYIPGSSLKGALRRVLLANEILKDPKMYQRLKQDAIKEKRPQGLKREGSQVETVAFRTLNRMENRSNALNDVMQGLRISDSRPVPPEQLTLCQKVDVNTEKGKRKINTLRECLKPGTKVMFDMVIDSSVLKLDGREIETAINNVSDFYTKVFVSRFGNMPRKKNEIYLGGGCGYGTKTIAYELLGSKDRVRVVSNLLEARFRKHRGDVQKGVSPHMLKCTTYAGNLCEMGKCQLDISPCAVSVSPDHHFSGA